MDDLSIKRTPSSRRLPSQPHGSMNPDSYQVDYGTTGDRLDIYDTLLNWMHSALLGCHSINAGTEDMYRIVQLMEQSLDIHFQDTSKSKLVSKIGPVRLFTSLPLCEAFKKMDQKYRMTSREFVPISIHECRQTFNLAQVLVSAPNLKLVTFDGDETLYPDGQNFEDGELSNLIVHILKSGCHVALVTAAGYGHKPAPYLVRLGRLIIDIAHATRKNPKVRKNFWVFGGESNYLFNLSGEDGSECTLKVVPYDQWEKYSSIGFTEDRDLVECSRLLDVAEHALRKGVKKLNLRATVSRKERAVGVSPGGSQNWVAMGSGARKIKTEILEELVGLVRAAVTNEHCTIPYCAFNGGSDVWVDVGSKAVALQIMKNMLNITATECLHIGDQFTESGNDTSVRTESPCIWVINPSETKAILRRICRSRGINYKINNLSDFGDDGDSDDRAFESDGDSHSASRNSNA